MRLKKITRDVNFPDRYVLWITTEDECLCDCYTQRIGDSTLFARVTQSGICQYGLQQNTDGPEHEAGYVWSSRPGVINQHFTLQIIDVYVNGCAGKAITVEAAKKLLPKSFKVIELDNIEPTYAIMKKTNYFKEKFNKFKK